jgi:GTP-binding protein
MPQTKFVLSKALKAGLRPIVVLNKMDRHSQRSSEVETEIFDLFVSLDAKEEQMSYPTLYASAREGWAVRVRFSCVTFVPHCCAHRNRRTWPMPRQT